jgi:hypothetical protein
LVQPIENQKVSTSFFLWNWRGRSPYRKTLLKQTIRKKQGSNSRDQERDKKKSKEDS